MMLRLTEHRLRSLIKTLLRETTSPTANTWGQSFIQKNKLEKPQLLQNYRVIFNKERIAFYLNYHALYLSETGLGHTQDPHYMSSFTASIGKSIKAFFKDWIHANPDGSIPYYDEDDIGYEIAEFMLEGLHGEADIFQIEIRNINTGKNILTAYDYSDTEVDYGDEDEGDVGGVVSMSSAPTIYRPSDDDLLADENIDKFDKMILKNLAIIKVIRWYLSNEWQSYSAGQTPNDKASNYNIPHGSTSDSDWVDKFGTAPSTSPIPTSAPIPQPSTPKLSSTEKALKQKNKEAEIYSQWDQQNQSLNDKYFKKPTPTKPKNKK
jgi:hypothetical protein